MRWNKVVKAGRFSGKISIVWRERIASVAPPDVTGRTTTDAQTGETGIILSAFDPLPQREAPVKYILVEEPDGQKIGGWSIQSHSPHGYRLLRKFNDYSDTLEAWGMLRRGKSERHVRNFIFAGPALTEKPL